MYVVVSRIAMVLAAALWVTGCAHSPAASTLDSTSLRSSAFAVTAKSSAYNRSAIASAVRNATGEGLPGVVVHVRGPKGEYTFATGMSDTKSRAPMREDHLFRLADNSKAFLALTAADMHTKGLLDLDAPVAKWLSSEILERVANTKVVTLRQLLNHTSGIPEYLNDHFLLALTGEREKNWKKEEALSFAFDLDALFAPGSSWRFSNTNYLLAGLVLDAISGRDHYLEIRDRVLSPLGLSNTYDWSKQRRKGELARGYVGKDEGLSDVTEYDLSSRISDGTMVGTARDLAQFIEAIGSASNIGGFTAETREEMFRHLVPTSPGGYGLGIQVFEIGDKGEIAIGHGGSSAGYRSEMFYIPSQKVSVAVLANRSKPSSVFDEMVIDLLVAVLEAPQKVAQKPKKAASHRSSFSF